MEVRRSAAGWLFVSREWPVRRRLLTGSGTCRFCTCSHPPPGTPPQADQFWNWTKNSSNLWISPDELTRWKANNLQLWSSPNKTKPKTLNGLMYHSRAKPMQPFCILEANQRQSSKIRHRWRTNRSRLHVITNWRGYDKPCRRVARLNLVSPVTVPEPHCRSNWIDDQNVT
jgi:hypothetical protein